ncbi:MAG: GNAT family N-acetyltransferase [Chloroflexota bacterium]
MPPSSERLTIAGCERNQTDWFRSLADACGGREWVTGPLIWVAPAPDGDAMLMFPHEIPAEDLRRGVTAAWDQDYSSIGVWLGLDVDPRPLASAGFERGWQPSWMARRTAGDLADVDPRVALEEATPEYDDHGRCMLRLVTAQPTRTWHAVARVDGHQAGRAWAHSDGETIGIYDMAVWPAYRRQGLGRSLLHTVAAAAVASSGPLGFVLNATPEGEHLYARTGFTRLGEGATWWLHRPR